MTALRIPSCNSQTNNNNKRTTPVSYLHRYTCSGLLENKIVKYEITTLLTYHKLKCFRKNRRFFEVPEITKTLGTFGQTYPSAGQFSETRTVNRWELLILNHLDQSLCFSNQNQGSAVKSYYYTLLWHVHNFVAPVNRAHMQDQNYFPELNRHILIFLHLILMCRVTY